MGLVDDYLDKKEEADLVFYSLVNVLCDILDVYYEVNNLIGCKPEIKELSKDKVTAKFAVSVTFVTKWGTDLTTESRTLSIDADLFDKSKDELYQYFIKRRNENQNNRETIIDEKVSKYREMLNEMSTEALMGVSQ